MGSAHSFFFCLSLLLLFVFSWCPNIGRLFHIEWTLHVTSAEDKGNKGNKTVGKQIGCASLFGRLQFLNRKKKIPVHHIREDGISGNRGRRLFFQGFELRPFAASPDPRIGWGYYDDDDYDAFFLLKGSLRGDNSFHKRGENRKKRT